MATFTWAKRVTEIGLAMMSEEARSDRISLIARNSAIDGSAVASLIDECAAAAGVFLDSNQEKITPSEAEVIREQLKTINGTSAVANVDPDELVSWVTEMQSAV